MIKINLQKLSKEKNLPKLADFKKWAKITLKNEKNNVEITIRIVDEKEIKNLNKKYRKKNTTTNVLSFPFEIPKEIKTNLLGDIVICAPIIKKEAKKYKKIQKDQWAHITIHGILHLLGYDHIREEDAEIMEKKEQELLRNCSL